MFEGPAAR
jgi:hypothetical protein